jgi:hypothetical protein
MTGTNTSSPTDVDADHHPEPVCDHQEEDDVRRVAPETEEVEADEAGYGYGV